MTINLQNCIDRQTEIGAHPKFWEKSETEIMLILARWLQDAAQSVAELSDKKNISRNEYSLLESSRKLIEIATAE